MTLIIAKQCSNGVLLICDSASTPEVGAINNNAVKWLQGEWFGQSFALVFAGYAGNLDGIPTLDVIHTATSIAGRSLQNNLSNAIHDRLNNEVNEGDWTDDATGAVDEPKRARFASQERIAVFLSVRHNEWWIIDLTANHENTFAQQPHTEMRITPGGTGPAFEELLAMCIHTPQSLREATLTASAIFHRASILFPNQVRFPGRIVFHKVDGVTTESFSNVGELLAASEQHG